MPEIVKFDSSDRTVKSLTDSLVDKELDLQPDFQRGTAWSTPKKQRLVDSILRDWYVPPIHVIQVHETAKDEVLDGQQRLRTISEFANNEFAVDGTIVPHDAHIASLHGKRYVDLPDATRRRFDKFVIRVFTLKNFQPSEPGELFFRLNQGVILTPAEQRNAFVGRARRQIKSMTNRFERLGITEEVLGFSNARMAYDDVVARFCMTIEHRTLAQKVTAAQITQTFRSRTGFAPITMKRALGAFRLLANAATEFSDAVRFNKATLHSWLCLCDQLVEHRPVHESGKWLGRFVTQVESARSRVTDEASDAPAEPVNRNETHCART